ncbi:hypothetical protein GCM10011506_47020 [Marivirga lumbricoides]|uniref:Uncharacterized protein n=1 Tax=Marivirga lumbricoides TaxID=1046115 RepID=A0ABQ1N6Q9_9BACT|nr:hypothetical protein GCM10011506_47020 [Marivirga lumbricoides]
MKALKWILIILVAFTAIGVITYWILDKPLPDGEPGIKAENLADKMLQAVNDSAWKETGVISWNFANKHQHIWDKDRHLAKVSWEEYDIYINLNTVTGKAIVKGKQIKDSAATAELVKEAYEYWANDSFWLNPIAKIRDSGTERLYVDTENPETESLLVTYTSGGITPGDSYQWLVDKSSGLPFAVKMWVQIIPLGGVEFTWENWIRTETNALIATEHLGPVDLTLTEIRSYSSIKALEEGDIFKILD